MKLWLLTRPEHLGYRYDDYIGAVVAAETEDEARKIHPGGPEVCNAKWIEDTSWIPTDSVEVKLLGEASSDVAGGVVLDSYNAG